MKRAEISHSIFSAGFLLGLFFLWPSLSLADCIAPAGVAGKQIYNSTLNQMEFCDGSAWQTMKGNISGQLKLGDDASVCDASKEGTIRYNNASKTLEFCNGTAWSGFVTGGGASADPDPDAFSFTDLIGQSINERVYSNKITLAGFIGPVLAQVTGSGSPRISVNNGAFSAVANVNPGDIVQLSMDTSSSPSTMHSAVLTIGAISDTWTTTTRGGGTRIFYTQDVYASFALGGLAGADRICQQEAADHSYPGTWIALISVDGTDASSRVAWEYPITNQCDGSTVETTSLFLTTHEGIVKRGGDCSASQGVIMTGSTTSGGNYGDRNCEGWFVNYGSGQAGLSDNTSTSWISWGTRACSLYNRIYCVSADPLDNPDGSNIPDVFTFSTLSDQSLGATIQSTETRTLANFTGSLLVRIEGPGNPEFSINSGAYTNQPTSVSAGDTLRLRLTTLLQTDFDHEITLRVGALSVPWTVRTETFGMQIFYTFDQYQAFQFGGVDRAHDICKQEANVHGYTGSWKAFLSDDLRDASQVVSVSYPIVNACDKSIVELNDLYGSTHEGLIKEGGTCSESQVVVMTGTQGSGLRYGGRTCDSWVYSAGIAQAGLSDNLTSSWTSWGTRDCEQYLSFYCVSQPDTPESTTTTNAFSFTDQTNQTLSTQVTSNSQTITGFAGSLTVSISGPGDAEFSVNGGPYDPYPKSINPGETLQIRMFTSSVVNKQHDIVVKVGATTDTWSVTTVGPGTKIFTTVSTYNGNLGGLAGADAICATEAAGFSYGGTWKAVLSDETTSAVSRLTIAYPIVNICDNSIVELTDIWNTTNEGLIKQGGGCSSSQRVVKTGSDTLGGISAGLTCTNWSSTSGNGRAGLSDNTTTSWISWGSRSCANSEYLYCVSQ